MHKILTPSLEFPNFKMLGRWLIDYILYFNTQLDPFHFRPKFFCVPFEFQVVSLISTPPRVGVLLAA